MVGQRIGWCILLLIINYVQMKFYQMRSPKKQTIRKIQKSFLDEIGPPSGATTMAIVVQK